MKSERVNVIHAVSSMAPINQKTIDIFHATWMLKDSTWLARAGQWQERLRHNLRSTTYTYDTLQSCLHIHMEFHLPGTVALYSILLLIS